MTHPTTLIAQHAAITCPTCGRTSFNRNDRENGWCGHCTAHTAPPGVHPEIVTIRVAADRARLVAGIETDPVAQFVRAFAGVLEVCSSSDINVGSIGHAHIHAAAIDFLTATRHLEQGR